MERVTVLGVLASPADRQCLQNIVNHSNWELRLASGIDEIEPVLQARTAGVILTDCHFASGQSWTDVLSVAQAQPVPPSVIVTGEDTDARLWAEVLNLGAYDMLMKPLRASEMIRVVSLAWLSWKSRRDAATGRAVRPQEAGFRNGPVVAHR
jgi:DNA-binding NtrC family response regulator